MTNRHNSDAQEYYCKSCIWSTIEITSLCCIIHTTNIFNTIIGSICCYANNCYAYHKFLEFSRTSHEQQIRNKDMIWKTLLLPCYPFYFCYRKYKEQNSQISIDFKKVYPFVNTTITIVVKQPPRNENENDKDCPICLSAIENNDKVYDKCHQFHRKCIEEWRKTNLANSNKCPICIRDLDDS